MLSNTTIGLLGVLLILLVANKTVADDADEFLDEINTLRRHYANKYKVPNMNKLYWSEDLVAIIKFNATSWTDWISTDIDTYHEISKRIETELEEFLAKNDDEKTEHSFGTLKFVAPLQQYIGCEMESRNVCYIGLEKETNLWDFDATSDTVPGSDCSEGYENDNGLCALIDPTKTSFFGSPEKLIADINSLRQKYANEFNVPDMHKLTWSEELVAIAKPLKWADSWPDAREKWRYTLIESYGEQEIDWMVNKVKAYIDGTEDERKTILESGNTYYMGRLEFLIPLKTLVGCVPQIEDDHIVCLLGPLGTFAMPNLDGDSTDAPGSKCLKGYANVDGLCSPYVPTTEAPSTQHPKQAPQKPQKQSASSENSDTTAKETEKVMASSSVLITQFLPFFIVLSFFF